MKFRFDINALRALAVMLVVFYHFQIPFFSGGYSGVDIFFVISGYLMSKIVLSKINEKSFSLIDFYKKRAYRIIPALLIMILAVLLLGNVFFFEEMQRKIAEFGTASALFLSNIYYYFNSGYFDLASKSNPFLHSWSLSVEWQFYILFPLLILGLCKIISPNSIGFKISIIGLTISSFIYTIWLGKHDSSQAFYSIGTRAWEMLVGCSIVASEERFLRFIHSIYRKIISIIAFAVLLIFAAIFDDKLLWPSYYTIVPVAATSLILLCQTNFKLFENAVLQYMGKISYSLYLWHWPIYVFALTWGYSSLEYTPILLILSLLFAHLSYTIIETKWQPSLRSITYTSITVLIIGIGSALFPLNQFLIPNNIKNLSNYRKNYENQIQKQFKTGECFIFSESQYAHFNSKECLNFAKNKSNILLIGDSHAAQFSYSLSKIASQHNAHILQATTSHCFPVPNTKGRSENAKLMHFIFNEFLPKNKDKIDLVIVSANWKDMQGYSQKELEQKWIELAKYFNENGISYKILGQTETYNYSFPEIAAKRILYPIVNEQNFVEENSKFMNNRLKSKFPSQNYIDLYQLPDIKHISSDNTTPYMLDDNHFSTFGTDQVIKAISQHIFTK